MKNFEECRNGVRSHFAQRLQTGCRNLWIFPASEQGESRNCGAGFGTQLAKRVNDPWKFQVLSVLRTLKLSQAGDQFRRGSSPFYSYGAAITVPLSNRAARQSYRIDKAQQRQLLLRLKKLEQSIMVDIEDAVKLAQTNFERVDATKQASLYAQAALEAEQKKLENGKSTSFQVLIIQRDLTNARSQEIRALADYNNSLAQLALSEGTTLQRRRMSIDVK